MNKQNLIDTDKETEKRYIKKDKKKKYNMKVSGASVRNLQKMIANKKHDCAK